jgi:phosphocarrier protein HPr
MPELRVTVASKVGLHARPAALLAKAASGQAVPVSIRKEGGEQVDAASVLGLMTLGAMHGDEVILSAEGVGADEALSVVADIITTDLDGE